MAKRTVHICDGNGCGAVLVNPEDGFVVSGSVKSIPDLVGDARVLVTPLPSEAPDAPAETALCRECMAKTLGLQAP